MGLNVGAQHEERGPQAEAVELGEEGRRGRRVGPVVEGQGHVAGRAEPGEAGQVAPSQAGPGGEEGHGVQGERRCPAGQQETAIHCIWARGAVPRLAPITSRPTSSRERSSWAGVALRPSITHTCPARTWAGTSPGEITAVGTTTRSCTRRADARSKPSMRRCGTNVRK